MRARVHVLLELAAREGRASLVVGTLRGRVLAVGLVIVLAAKFHAMWAATFIHSHLPINQLSAVFAMNEKIIDLLRDREVGDEVLLAQRRAVQRALQRLPGLDDARAAEGVPAPRDHGHAEEAFVEGATKAF